MFGRQKKSHNELLEDEARAQDAVGEASAAEATRQKKLPEKKGVPTPRRKDQEAARRRPLVHNDRKAARQAQRQQIQEQRTKVRQAMQTGDEKYLPLRDRGPQKRFAREFVDARLGIGEWLLILVLVFLFASFVMTPETRGLIAMILWVIMAAVIIECFWVARQVRQRLEAKFGLGNLEKGVRFYAAMRSLQMRRLRLPKPMNARGQYPS